MTTLTQLLLQSVPYMHMDVTINIAQKVITCTCHMNMNDGSVPPPVTSGPPHFSRIGIALTGKGININEPATCSMVKLAAKTFSSGRGGCVPAHLESSPRQVLLGHCCSVTATEITKA